MLDYILHDLPMIQGWAFLAAATEQDAWLQFAGIKRTSKGYIKQEIDKLVAQALQHSTIDNPPQTR